MRSTFPGPTVLLATIVLLASACGGSSDNDAGSGGAGFCEQFVALEDASESSADGTIDEESLAQLKALRDSAPDEIRDDMILLVDLFEKMSTIDENDEGSTEEIFGLLFDPEVIAAGENIEAYGVSECGMEPSTDDTGIGDAATGDGSTELDDPLYDPFFDDPVDPNEASIDGLQLYLDENYPEAAWRPRLSSFGHGGDDFEAGGVDVEADAIAICEAILAYATGFAPDADVEVNTFSDDFGDEIPVATGNATDGCVTV